MDASLSAVPCMVGVTPDAVASIKGLDPAWYMLRYNMAAAHVELYFVSRADGLALQSFFSEAYGVLASLYRLSADGNSFDLEV